MTVSRDQRIMRHGKDRYVYVGVPGTSAIGWSAKSISRGLLGEGRLCGVNVKAVENVGFANLGMVASELQVVGPFSAWDCSQQWMRSGCSNSGWCQT